MMVNTSTIRKGGERGCPCREMCRTWLRASRMCIQGLCTRSMHVWRLFESAGAVQAALEVVRTASRGCPHVETCTGVHPMHTVRTRSVLETALRGFGAAKAILECDERVLRVGIKIHRIKSAFYVLKL